jgi:hypothetical protein
MLELADSSTTSATSRLPAFGDVARHRREDERAIEDVRRDPGNASDQRHDDGGQADCGEQQLFKTFRIHVA